MYTERPLLDEKIKIADFKNYYWLKAELMIFCRELGLSGRGGKIEIANRISEYLETGKVSKKATIKKPKLPKATEPITNDTVLGIEYRTYKEKKEFLQLIIGKQFRFTIHLLDYFKKNTGKNTYGDLIKEWYKEKELKKNPNFIKKIAPQFEYNTYIRDFMKDNKNRTRNDAIKYWKIKKSKPGDNKYLKSDLL
jgi:hypothetical protein